MNHKRGDSAIRLAVAILAIIGLLCLSGCNFINNLAAEMKQKQDALLGDNGEIAGQSNGASVTVYCMGENGEAVSGCSVKCCVGDACYLQVTGDDGCVVFENIAGEYSVEVIATPDNYAGILSTTKDESANTFQCILGLADNTDATQDKSQSGSQDSMSSASNADYADASLLSDIDLTGVRLIMVNYWEPWCSPCVSEMPDLERLYRAYKDQGLLIVGLYSTADGASEVIADAGVTYPCIQYDGNSIYAASAVPDTVFVTPEFSLLPVTVDEIANDYEEDYKQFFTDLLAGVYDEYKDMPEYKEDFEQDYAMALAYMENPESLREELRYAAEEQYESYPYGYVGSSDYASWERRMLTRLKER